MTILSGWQQYPAIQKQQVHSFNFYGFKANHKLTGADIVSLAEMTIFIMLEQLISTVVFAACINATINSAKYSA